MQNNYVQLLVVATLFVAASCQDVKITKIECKGSNELNADCSINADGCVNVDYTPTVDFGKTRMEATVTTQTGENVYNLESDCAHKNMMEKICESGSPDDSCDDNFALMKNDGMNLNSCCPKPFKEAGKARIIVYGDDKSVLEINMEFE